MTTLDIYKFSLSKESLALLPESQRAFFVYAGHISNELNWLNRITLILQRTGAEATHLNETSPSTVNRALFEANAAQSIIGCRLLTGKVGEASKFLDQNCLKAAWHKKIRRKFNLNGKKSWQLYCKRHRYLQKFKEGKTSKKEVISLMRNRFSFHYSKEGYAIAGKNNILSDPFILYISQITGTTLYMGSEHTMLKAFVDMLSPNQYKRSIDRWMSQTLKLTGAMINIFEQSIAELLDLYILKQTSDKPELITFDNPPDNNSITLPFFINPSRLNKE